MTAGVKGERRVVTVLFCDVKGSTTIAEQLDPEEWAEIINEAFAHLIAPVERYDGLVARLMGDAILAFFGAPVAHEDDPTRALLAALEIVEACRGLGERLRSERGIGDFAVRIGINTGLAVLGDVGRGVAVEYTALGDAVNVAARVQSAAKPGEILVTDATARLVGGAFDLEPLGEVEVKGRAAPVRMLRVMGQRTGPAAGALAPLVGRDSEMRALEEAAAAVRAGDGRILMLLGEAGLGKSRLIDELRMRAPELRWFTAHSPSYGGSRPLLLFREHLLAWSGAREGDPPEVVREKLGTAVREVLPDEVEAALPVIELVSGLGSRAEIGAGEELRREIGRVVAELARREAKRGPAVIVFDDLQWSDAASADLLGELLAIADDVAVLFLLAFRPDRRSVAWRVRQRVETDYPHRQTEIALAPLDAAASEALLDADLGGREIPERLRAAILARAEGNPLFIEQFAVAIGEDPASAVAVPDTLVSLVASRLDRLEDRPRRALQAASVIGRRFAHRILERVVQANGALDRDLVELQRADLIKEEQRVPDRVYAFRHALLQEVAYGSLLQRRRRELHALVAASLEGDPTAASDEVAALIGRHYAEAGDVRAVPHLRSAAERALRLHALEDALDLCDRALAVARRVGGEVGAVCDLYSYRGRALELRTDYDGALATYEEMQRVGVERKDRAMELRALSHQITVYATPTSRSDLAKARQLIDVAIPATRELGDRALLARVLWSAIHAYAWSREEDKAAQAGREALEIARELGLKELEALAALDFSRFQRFREGWGDAIGLVGRAAQLFEELGNKPMLADALSTLAVGYTALGRYDEAIAQSTRALAVATEIGNLWNQAFSRFHTPWAYFDRGDFGRAIGEYEGAIAAGRAAGFIAIRMGPAADLAWMHHSSGNDDRALAILEEIHAFTGSRPEAAQWELWRASIHARVLIARGDLDGGAALLARVREGDVQAVLGTGLAAGPCAAAELAFARADPDGAAAAAREARLRIEELGYVPMTDELAYIEGEAHRRAGRADAARDAFAHALAISDRLRAVRVRERVLRAQALMADADGQADRASELRREADAIVERIAASLEPLGLRDRYLAYAATRPS